MEKTNIELLQDYAKSSKRKITIKESPYPKPKGIRNIIKYKRTAYTALDKLERNFFVWFYDYHTPTQTNPYIVEHSSLFPSQKR